MQQYPPSVAIANAALPAAVPPSHRSPGLHLLATFAVGLTSLFFFSPIGGGPWWWQPVLAAAVLFMATFCSQVFALGVSGAFSLGEILRGPIAAGVATGGLGTVLIVLFALSQNTHSAEYTSVISLQWIILEAVLVPVLVGLASALVAQSQPRATIAFGGAALGWLVASMTNVVASVLSQGGFSTEGAASLDFFINLAPLLALSFAGLTLALLGGLIGWGLRALASRSTTRAPGQKNDLLQNSDATD